jgi:hypothetical protein
LLLAVAGTLVLMAGVLLGVVTAVVGLFETGGWLLPSVIAGGLIAAGLCCGVLLVAVTEPVSRRDGTPAAPRAPVPASHRRSDDTVRPPSAAILGHALATQDGNRPCIPDLGPAAIPGRPPGPSSGTSAASAA